MAKGDSDKVQNQVNQQGATAQQQLTNLTGENSQRTTNFQNLFSNAVGQNQNNYNDVTNAYNAFLKGMPSSSSLYSSFLGPKYAGASATGPASANAPTVDPNAHPVDQLLAKYGAKDTGAGSGVTDASYWKQKYDSTNDPYYLERLENDLKGGGMDAYSPGGGGNNASNSSGISGALAGYQNFADTGGFSPTDIQAIRARSVAPIRGIADNARREISRQAAIHPGAANTTAALAKSARDSEYATGDISTNAEANIAQLMQQGKLYGLGGLASTGLSNKGLDINNTNTNRGLDLSAITGASGNQLQGLSGLTSLYGTTPGLTKTFGDQVLGSAGQGVQLGGLQDQLAQAIMQAQLGKAQVPGNFQSGMGNLASIFGLGGSIAGAL